MTPREVLRRHYGGFLNDEAAHKASEYAIQELAREGYQIVRSDGALCKGSWLLGTACGCCPRCQADAPNAVAALRDALTVLERRLKLIIGCIPAPSGLGDYIDAIKVRFFDACREQLYDENGELRR